MTFKVGCIGAGYFAAFHYDAWSRMDGAQTVAAVDQDIEKAKDTGFSAFTKADEMLASVQPDIVDVITPPPTHLDTIKLALEFNPKVIICQKPFCLDVSQAREATELAERAGVPLVVHENFRFQPWYRAIKNAIETGSIGELHQMSFRMRPGDGQGPDAYLSRQPYFQKMPKFLVRETGVHWIDTFLYLAGPPKRVFADLRQMNPVISGEDAGILIFDHGEGVRSTLDGNRLLDHAATNTRCTMGEGHFEGTKGTLTLFGDGSVHLRKFGELETTELLPATDEKGFAGDSVFNLQRHVIDALNGVGKLENTARDYLRVIEIENAIYQSADEGRWIDVSTKV